MPPSVQCIDPKCPSNTEKNDLGPCPTCKVGTIRVTYSKAGKRFAGCSEWPRCTQTYPLRPRGSIVPTGESCPDCGAPVVSLGSITECINMDCGSRKKKRPASEAEPAAPSDSRVGKVVKVVVSDRKKKSPAKKAAKKEE
jgi:DNA topoisomerase-1